MNIAAFEVVNPPNKSQTLAPLQPKSLLGELTREQSCKGFITFYPNDGNREKIDMTRFKRYSSNLKMNFAMLIDYLPSDISGCSFAFFDSFA